MLFSHAIGTRSSPVDLLFEHFRRFWGEFVGSVSSDTRDTASLRQTQSESPTAGPEIRGFDATSFADVDVRNVRGMAVAHSLQVVLAGETTELSASRNSIFLEGVVWLCMQGESREAMLRVHSRLADDLDHSDFESINSLLQSVPVGMLPPKVALGFLMGTAAVGEAVSSSRSAFRAALRRRYVETAGEEQARLTVDAIE